MSAISDAITNGIINSVDPDRKTEGKLSLIWFDQQESSYAKHMNGTCPRCDASPSGQCRLADLLEEFFRKVYLS